MCIQVTSPKVEPTVYETPETCPHGCGGQHFEPHGVKGEVKPLHNHRYSEVRIYRLTGVRCRRRWSGYRSADYRSS